MNILESIVCAWLRFKYGGDVYALKPPLGYHPFYSPKPIWWIVCYKIRYEIWLTDKILFYKYGKPMRDAWENNKKLGA